MFDIEHPAKNINELAEYLKGIETGNTVYRGQIEDYGSLLPSFYRNKISPARIDEKTGTIIFQFDKNNHLLKYDPKKDSERNVVKRRTMNELMKCFGKSFGNIAAQQYGINSECLDVTSDINVAAFFATHAWPRYDRTYSSDKLGIIYRIPYAPESPIMHAGIELDLSGVYLSCDRNPVPLLFSSFKYQHTENEFEELNNTYKFKLQHTISKPVICNAENVKSIIGSYFQEKHPDIDIEALYSTTRMDRQKAGFIIPSFVFNSYVPSRLQIKETHGIKAYVPSFVIHKEKMVVEDILAFPKIEKYYFRHSEANTALTREYLWPSAEDDYFYRTLRKWCSDSCKKYLDNMSIEIDDMENGILDMGYYI